MEQPWHARRTSARAVAALAGLLTGGALLRLAYLGKRSLWLDEALSVHYARASWPEFVHIMVTGEANMVAYFLVLRGWVHLGTSEWVVRLPSSFFSIATLAIVYAIGARLFGRRVGLAATALLAVNAFDIHYAQDARAYSLLALLVSTSVLYFVRALESPNRGNWTGYVLASVLALYTHLFAALVLVAQWLSVAFLPPRQVAWRQLARSVVAIGILVTPLVIFVASVRRDNLDWVQPPTVASVGGFVLTILGIGRAGDHISSRVVVEAACFIAVFGTCALVAARRALSTWKRSGRSTETWSFALLWMWLLVPIVLVLAATEIKPMFVDKYFFECLPALVLLLALGLCRLRAPLLAGTVGVAALALALNGVLIYYGRDRENWREATRGILDGARDGDALLLHPVFLRDPFDYYRERAAGSRFVPPIIDSSAVSDTSPENSLGERYDRVWLVVSHDPDSARTLRSLLKRTYPVEANRAFAGIDLSLYAKQPISAPPVQESRR